MAGRENGGIFFPIRTAVLEITPPAKTKSPDRNRPHAISLSPPPSFLLPESPASGREGILQDDCADDQADD